MIFLLVILMSLLLPYSAAARHYGHRIVIDIIRPINEKILTPIGSLSALHTSASNLGIFEPRPVIELFHGDVQPQDSMKGDFITCIFTLTNNSFIVSLKSTLRSPLNNTFDFYYQLIITDGFSRLGDDFFKIMLNEESTMPSFLSLIHDDIDQLNLDADIALVDKVKRSATEQMLRITLVIIDKANDIYQEQTGSNIRPFTWRLEESTLGLTINRSLFSSADSEGSMRHAASTALPEPEQSPQQSSATSREHTTAGNTRQETRTYTSEDEKENDPLGTFFEPAIDFSQW